MDELSRSRSQREVSQPQEPGRGQARAVRQGRVVWSLIGLKVVGNVLRSRRSYELTIVGAIMLAALAHQAHENQAQILARLIAWDRRQRQALHRRLQARPGRRRTR